MVEEHCGVISELFECDFTELDVLGSDHWTASTVKNENCRESPISTPLIPKPNKNEHLFLCCFAWARVVTRELWFLYWTALRALLKNNKCFLNFCNTLLFHSIFACEYSILSSLLTIRRLIVPQQPWIKPFYYINTNEIPGDLSRENMISSHVKITCYLHLWKDHRCYGYIINGAFHTKKLLKWNSLVFHWCLYNK